MDRTGDKAKGRSFQLKKVFEKTKMLFKHKKEGTDAVPGSDSRSHYKSHVVAPGQDEQLLRYSEGEQEVNHNPPNEHGEPYSINSPSPSTFVHPYSPVSALGPQGQQHAQREFLYDPSSEMPPYPTTYEYEQLYNRFQPADDEYDAMFQSSARPISLEEGDATDTTDLEAREELYVTLEDMLKHGETSSDIGQFLVKNYYDRDSLLDGLISRMSVRQESYTAIGIAVCELLGLIGQYDEEFPEIFQEEQLPSPTRYYSREQPSFDSAARTQYERQVGQGHIMGPRPLYPFPRPKQGEHEGPELLAPIPRRIAPIVPRWTESVIEQAQRDIDEEEVNIARRELELGLNITEDEVSGGKETPILRPATVDRIQRGYYDEELDGMQSRERSRQEDPRNVQGRTGYQ